MSKTIPLKAKIVEIGDNQITDVPQMYLMQNTGNRIFLDVNRDFLIDLVRGDGDTFSVYEDVIVTITISKA
jgi:hypothetical protein